MKENSGFDARNLADWKARIGDKDYVLDESDERSDEYAHFYFIGEHEGKEVVFDTIMYTLRLQHESEIFELAEEQARQEFPDYDDVMKEEEVESGGPREEEIGVFLAEAIADLEEEEAVKVREHVDIDTDAEFGIAIDVGLHVTNITDDHIIKFIRDYKADTLELDQTLYAFQNEENDAE